MNGSEQFTPGADMTKPIALLAPLVLNPTVLAVGLIGYGVYRLLSKDDETAEKEKVETPALPAPVPEPVASEPSPDDAVRRYMSELGKRSAAARAAKRAVG
jgi:hypothetical protein